MRAMGQQAWSKEDVASLERVVMEFRRMLVETFNEDLYNDLYILNIIYLITLWRIPENLEVYLF